MFYELKQKHWKIGGKYECVNNWRKTRPFVGPHLPKTERKYLRWRKDLSSDIRPKKIQFVIWRKRKQVDARLALDNLTDRTRCATSARKRERKSQKWNKKLCLAFFLFLSWPVERIVAFFPIYFRKVTAVIRHYTVNESAAAAFCSNQIAHMSSSTVKLNFIATIVSTASKNQNARNFSLSSAACVYALP